MRNLVCSLLFAAAAIHAEVKLPAILSDHMVLQQGRPVRIWGTGAPNEGVRVDFQGQSVSTTAGADGKWEAWLKPLSAAGPLEMTVAGTNSITIHDVLVGEVWVGSGQSNMEFGLSNAVNHDEEIANASYPLIHLFHVKRAVSEKPLYDVVGTWEVCSPQSVPRFSAVEYFFGRHLHQNLHVPVGLIESDWGGNARAVVDQPRSACS
jgi:sialate O-acetylesterase